MLLEVDRIHAYYGSSHVLHDVSLRVDQGEVVALLGRNGAGKSSTLKSIIGIVPPRRGHLRLQGRDIAGQAPFRIARAGVAYVPEERRIFHDLTVEENLMMGAMVGRTAAQAWTIERVVDLFPNLKDRLKHLGRQLSGGEQQMLAISRGLMSNPKLLLLDEPSEGLAPAVVDRMQEALHRLKGEAHTLLLAEQSIEFVKELAVRAYVLDKGAVAYEGTVATLLGDSELAQRYLAI